MGKLGGRAPPNLPGTNPFCQHRVIARAKMS